MTDDSYRDDTIGYSIGNNFHPRSNFLYMRWKIDQWNSIEPENLMNLSPFLNRLQIRF